MAYHLVIVFPIAFNAPRTVDGQYSVEKSHFVQWGGKKIKGSWNGNALWLEQKQMLVFPPGSEMSGLLVAAGPPLLLSSSEILPLLFDWIHTSLENQIQLWPLLMLILWKMDKSFKYQLFPVHITLILLCYHSPVWMSLYCFFVSSSIFCR